jgi:hypothetical protein
VKKCNHDIETCPVHSQFERTLDVVLACVAKSVVVRSKT